MVRGWQGRSFLSMQLRVHANQILLDRLVREMLIRQRSHNALLPIYGKPGTEEQKPTSYVLDLGQIHLVFYQTGNALFESRQPIGDSLSAAPRVLRGSEKLVESLAFPDRLLLS